MEREDSTVISKNQALLSKALHSKRTESPSRKGNHPSSNPSKSPNWENSQSLALKLKRALTPRPPSEALLDRSVLLLNQPALITNSNLSKKMTLTQGNLEKVLRRESLTNLKYKKSVLDSLVT